MPNGILFIQKNEYLFSIILFRCCIFVMDVDAMRAFLYIMECEIIGIQTIGLSKMALILIT